MQETQLRRLLDAGRSLVAELDLDELLDRLLEVARELTGARYAAIGVLDERREELERFITKGVDAETHRAIGDPPRGRGVLGVLIREQRPLRIADVASHPDSYGFPLAHPPMRTFLGVPLLVRGEAWGNLYLTEKETGAFTQDDEDAVTTLAGWAAIAIANARLYRDVRRQRDELQRANRALETTSEIARALGGVIDVEQVLELVVKRSRALLHARASELALLDGDELVLAAAAGQGVERARGTRLSVDGSVAGAAMRTGKPQRFAEVPEQSVAHRLLGARTALVTPMIFRNRSIGFLSVFDRQSGDGTFSDEDERLLLAFAASAATAVVTAQSASSEALSRSVKASEKERQYWAGALHDETLQQLAALKMLLASARRVAEPAAADAAVDRAIELITHGIADLRSLITELRPASLDELGPQPAVEALVDRVRSKSGLEIELDVRLAYEQGRVPRRHVPEVEVAIYRLVQEGLSNVVEHANATRAAIRISDPDGDDGTITIEVIDDGQGFDADEAGDGFGLVGMRERIALVHGHLEVQTRPGEGSRLVAHIPVRRRSG